MEHATANPKQAEHGKGTAPHARSPIQPQPATHPAMEMQQQAGNQAMQQLLRAGIIHAKLSISQPDDPEEREADHVADRIMRSHAGPGAVASSCSCSGNEEMCDECKQKKTASISRKAGGNNAAAAGHPVMHQLPRSTGHPLDKATRSFFEPRFGHDFSQVRVHSGTVAASSARAIQAHAFAAGNDIYFAAGKYSPETDTGRKLLAHELTHVVQKAESGAERLSRQEDGGISDAGTQTAHKDDELDAGTGTHPADPSSDDGQFNFEGVMLSTDSISIVVEIEKYIEEHGLDDAISFAAHFESELRTAEYNQQDRSGVPDENDKEVKRLKKMREVAPTFRLAMIAVKQKCDEFLVNFDGSAHKVLEGMLTASRERITSERKRYGLAEHTTEKTKWKKGELGEQYKETTYESTYSMDDNKGTQGLAKAAKALADKAHSVRSLMDARNKLMPIGTSEEGPSDAEMAPYREADEKVRKAVGEYNVLRYNSDKDYPILAAFDELDTTGTYYVDRTISTLTGFASRSGNDTAATLYNETADKLANIDKVADAVAKGDLRVWRLDPVVSLTLQQTAILPDELQKRLVGDKAKESTPGEILDIALGVLAIALGALAAIPTGGGSLAAGIAVAAGLGSAALGGYFAIEHLQQYALEAAANGTDFDKARAVSQVEPSLFWLAVDIIGAIGGAGADIHAAAATFKTLSTALKEAAELRQLAQQGEKLVEADAALARLKQEGDKVAPGLGEKLATKIGKEGTVLEKKAAMAAWEDSLNAESRAHLVDNPGMRAVYEDMDQEMRWLCTQCASDCLIDNISHAQVSRIRTVLNRMETEELERLRIYLHINKESIEPAIANLERVADDEGLKALLNRSLTEKANPPTAPLLTSGAATAARNAPGAVTGGEFLSVGGKDWLSSTGGTSGLIPRQVAAKLRGRTFASFDDFQAAFWQEVAADPALASGFKQANQTLMAGGEAPFAIQAQRQGGAAQGRYVLHHIVPIEHGGGVYDLDNLLVTSPKQHWGVIHSPTVTPAKFKQLPKPE